MIEVVLLDMGGVILSLQNGRGLPDSRFDWRGREALAERIRRSGGRVDMAQLDRLLFEPWRLRYKRRYQIGREAAWEPHLDRLRRATGVELDDLSLLESWFRPYGESLVAIPGAREAMESLRRSKLRLGLVSNVPMPGELYRRILGSFGLEAPLESLHFSYDEGSRKPSPLMIRRALSALGSDPSAAVMVGDRRGSDIAAGRAAGTRTVWIRTDDGGGPTADHEIDRISQLPELIERLAAS